jgi:repressor LexA
MRDLTERQREVLNYLAEYIEGRSYPPSIRDVAEHFSISVKGAHDHLRALKKKGCIRQEDKRSRTIELVREPGEEREIPEDLVAVPILGTVAAGMPVMAEENREGELLLHRSMLKKKPDLYFALKIRGDSMVGAGIMEGDMAIIEQQDKVRNGEIAVVMHEGEATIKTFYREAARVRLQPENPAYPPFYYSRDLQVLGRLALIIRSY